LLSAHNALAMVMHTGYTSKRGRILRKILHRTSATPHFFKTCIVFLLINWVIGMLIYLGTMPVRLANDNLQRIIIFLNFLLIMTFCIPPSCPIYFNVVYSFSLIRLKWKDILGTEPHKTVEAAHLKIMCFDKTGTLTEDKMEVNKIFKFEAEKHKNITNRSEE
jgi:P-type E1-E2 ATPase